VSVYGGSFCSRIPLVATGGSFSSSQRNSAPNFRLKTPYSRLQTHLDNEAAASAPGSRADYIQPAFELIDPPLHNRQTESCPTWLCRVEWLPNLALILG